MPSVIITKLDKSRSSLAGATGDSVMSVCQNHGIDGIEAVCGGAAACGTCHVYVDRDWLSALPPMEELEDIMLDEAEAQRNEFSRLSCQIILTPALDGIAITIPRAGQGEDTT